MSFEPTQAEDRIDARGVRRIGVAGAIVFFLAIATAALLLGAFGHPPAKESPAPGGTVERTLVLATKRGLDEKERDRAALAEWGWVDRDAGIARIPIDRAIDLYVASENDGGAP